MKKWMVLPCLLLVAAMAAAQTSSPVPAGTALMVKLETTLATFSNKAGDPFRGQLIQAVVVNGKTVIPAGATVEGRVTKVAEPRRISGKPTIGILAETLVLPTGACSASERPSTLRQPLHQSQFREGLRAVHRSACRQPCRRQFPVCRAGHDQIP